MKTLRYVLIIIIVLSYNNVFAQNKENPETFKKIIQDCYQALSNMGQSKNRAALLQYISPSYVRNVTFVMMSGEVRQTEQNYDTFVAHLQEVIDDYEDEKLKTTYTIENIVDVSVRNEVAMLTCAVTHETFKGDVSQVKGKSMVSFVFRKFVDKWKIIRSNTTRMEDAILQSVCTCQFFSNNNSANMYIANVKYPDIDEYKTALHQFRINPSLQGANLKNIEYSGKLYIWNQATSDLTADTDNQNLGKAKSIEDAIVLILQTHVYAKNCTRINLKK
jgi:flagellar biosynthesis chaperone FliJ